MAVRERRVGHPAVVPTPPELGAVANPERGGRGRSPGRGADDAPRIPPLCRTTPGSAVAHGRSHRGACCDFTKACEPGSPKNKVDAR